MTTTAPTKSIFSAVNNQQLLDQWQGHRRLTRKLIQAIPEDKLFTYSLGGMRTFAGLIDEFLSLTVPMVAGMATRKWLKAEELSETRAWGSPATSKEEILERWDQTTDAINHYWNLITEERLQEDDLAMGQWPGKVYSFVFYFIDNETHHRGQMYVYLRTLGIEPPFFWDRE